MATVLCTGADRTLIETRTLILRQAGHTAVPATGEPELAEACAHHNFEIAVIGQLISNAQKQRVFHLVRKYCPTVKVLELYAPFSGRALTEADDWLEVPARVPAELAEYVERLVAKQS
jgi:hypothetical protein